MPFGGNCGSRPDGDDTVAGSTSETETIETHRFSFWCMDGLLRFDGPVLISDMRILGPPLTSAPNGRFGSRVDGTLARTFGRFCRIGRVWPRVRPVGAAGMAAGPNALRGSGPKQKRALWKSCVDPSGNVSSLKMSMSGAASAIN